VTPEELAPTPETPAPVETPAPEPREAAEETFDRGLFSKMLDQTTRGGIPEELKAEEEPPAPAPKEPREPREPREATPAREPAAARAQKRWAGRFDTPEAMESGFQDLERARQHAEGERGRAEEAARRLERLLVASLSGKKLPTPEDDGLAPMAPPARRAPEPPMDLEEAVTVLRQEHERLGLADPEGDPRRYARALAVVLAQDDYARQAYMGPTLRELQRETAERNEVEKLKQDFFTAYPDLRSVRLDRLRAVAVETEGQLRRAKPELTGEAFVKEWFDLTAREARATFRTEPAPQTATAPHGRAAGARSRPETSRATGAPFAESPSPRASEPALTGQAFHLARVFGRGA
jgi:hypothetical protein